MDYSKLSIVLVLIASIGMVTWAKIVKKSHADDDLINEIIVPPQQEEDIEENVEPEEPVGTYEAALQKAKEKNAKVFLYFGASWCGPCQQMKSKTFPNKAVQKALSEYITCILDVDQEKNLAIKYKIRGVPSYYIIDKDENIEKKDSGYKPASQFVAWLR